MSRINTSMLQQPSGHEQIPEIDLGPGDDPNQVEPVQPEKAPDPTPHLQKVNEQLQLLNSTASNNAALAQIAGNPLVQQILAAQQAGKKMKLVDEEPEQMFEKEEVEPEVDWQKLSENPAEMGKHLVKSTVGQLQKALVPSLLKMMDSKLAPLGQLSQQVQSLQTLVRGYQAREVKTEISALERQNPEQFEALRPAMATIAEENPGLSLKRVYALACAEAGLPLVQGGGRTASERPTQSGISQTNGYADAHEEQTGHRIARPPASATFQRRSNDPNANFDMSLASLLSKKDFRGMPGVTED